MQMIYKSPTMPSVEKSVLLEMKYVTSSVKVNGVTVKQQSIKVMQIQCLNALDATNLPADTAEPLSSQVHSILM